MIKEKKYRGRIIAVEKVVFKTSYIIQGIGKKDQCKYESSPEYVGIMELMFIDKSPIFL